MAMIYMFYARYWL